jgi:hypothetical protein
LICYKTRGTVLGLEHRFTLADDPAELLASCHNLAQRGIDLEEKEFTQEGNAMARVKKNRN